MGTLQELPKHIDPIRLADNQAVLQGALPFASMTRLLPLLCTTPGNVMIDLHFEKDDLGWRVITGLITADIQMRCQRCNQPITITLQLSPCLSPILREAQATELPTAYEPLVTHGEPVSLLELVEDELLLGLPMVPRHDWGKCPKALPDCLR